MKENKVKWYGVVIGIVTALAQHGIYTLGNVIGQWVGITPYSPKIDCIDNLFVLLPVFIVPYVWSYLYWAMAPMAVSKCEVGHFKNYLASYFWACAFGMVILIFAPTYMDRTAEGLMDLPSGFFYDLMRLWYALDGGERAYNLLPSFHCIVSTISFLGVYKRPEVPKWYRVYSLLLTVLICLSTCFVKQHYVLDVVTGVTIATVSYWICMKRNVGRMFDRPTAWLQRRLKKA